MNKLDHSRAIRLEQFEEAAWTDMYQAAPPEFAAAFGLQHHPTPDGTFFLCSKIPFVHFNGIYTLGLLAPASSDTILSISTLYRQAGCKKAFVVISPLAKPPAIRSLLEADGFQSGGAWERIHRSDQALKPLLPTSRRFFVEDVAEPNGQEWADFICKTYGLPTQAWLRALVGRNGWHHVLLKEDGKTIAVRTFYLRDQQAWIGIDAPVPGVMTQDFEADYVLMHALVGKGLALGAKDFMADLERVDDQQKLASYAYFEELGFTLEYRRQILAKELR